MVSQTLLMVISVITIFAYICMAFEFVFEMVCFEHKKTNANCIIFGPVVQIAEPLFSVIMVLVAVVVYIICDPKRSCRHYVDGLCTHFCQGWFWKRLITLLFVVFFYLCVFSSADKKDSFGQDRYLVMAFGVTSWFVFLCIANVNGPLSWVTRHRVTGNGIRVFSFFVFMFAALTNLAEFVIATLYLSTALKSVVGVIGLSITVVLRLEFVNFFFNMAIFSLKRKQYGGKSKFLHDTWDAWEDIHPNSEECEPVVYNTDEENVPI